MIDLRSDTVTQPTEAMRRAMASAEVGDDVLGDDPTVAALEKRTAEVLDKESAVYVPSGTMANQLALRSHTEPGDEVLLEGASHICTHEAGGPAALSGVSCRLLKGERGIFTAEELQRNLRPPDVHEPLSKLVCIENTHNCGGGSIWPLGAISEAAAVARSAGLKMHLDGARLWNASAATGTAERQYARHFDSVSVCFSKGLGAPVGSALAGSAEFIRRARRFRKMFGGGMRQAGIIAAGALYALEHHRARLVEDHANAAALARGIQPLRGIEVDPSTIQTNMVYFRVTTMPARELVGRLGRQGLAMLPHGEDVVRAVTSLMVAGEDIQRAVEIMRKMLG